MLGFFVRLFVLAIAYSAVVNDLVCMYIIHFLHVLDFRFSAAESGQMLLTVLLEVTIVLHGFHFSPTDSHEWLSVEIPQLGAGFYILCLSV